MESTPVWGVEIKKEVVEPLEAPFLKKPIPVGNTPQEQRGMGTPNRDAFSTDLKLGPPM